MVVVEEVFDGGVFYRAVHSLDLAIGPWVVWLGWPMLDLLCPTDHVEAHLPGICYVPVPGLLNAAHTALGNRGDGYDVINGNAGNDHIDAGDDEVAGVLRDDVTEFGQVMPQGAAKRRSWLQSSKTRDQA